MATEEPGEGLPPALSVMGAWQTTVIVGVATLILGLIVSFHPGGSLNVVVVLLGVLMVISGVFHLIRMFGSGQSHRVWLGISGLLLIVIGVLLIRHLDLTVAVIGLIVGITWIVQGLSALAGGMALGPGQGRGWWIFFGLISLIAGIVVTAFPVNSVTALAVLVGIWFIVLGLFEIIGGFMLRHAARKMEVPVTSPRRAGEGAAST